MDDLDEFLEPAFFEEGLFEEPAVLSDDDVDIDLDKMSAADASLELYNELVSLKWDGVLRATHVCRLAFWACKGGCNDLMLEKLGSTPRATRAVATTAHMSTAWQVLSWRTRAFIPLMFRATSVPRQDDQA